MFPTPPGKKSMITLGFPCVQFSSIKFGGGGMGIRERDETLSIFRKIEIVYMQIWR